MFESLAGTLNQVESTEWHESNQWPAENVRHAFTIALICKLMLRFPFLFHYFTLETHYSEHVLGPIVRFINFFVLFFFFGYCLNSEQSEFLFLDDEDEKKAENKMALVNFCVCTAGVNVLFEPHVAFIYTLRFIEVFHLADKNNCGLRFLSLCSAH